MKKLMLIGMCLVVYSVMATTLKGSAGAHPVSKNVRGHEDTEWSIFYGYGLVHNAQSPRVFLIGDSITAQYEGAVVNLLKAKGVMTTYWASSYCLTSPCYLKFLDGYLSETEYDVIHFNNGLHSLGTPTEAWAEALRKALTLIRVRCPKTRIVWTTSTPLKDAKKTEKVKELNAAAAKIVAELGDVVTDDLFETMDPLNRMEHWSDTYHFKASAKKIQAEQVAKVCLSAVCFARGRTP